MSINRGKFDHTKLSNSRIVGPGSWKALHILAKFSDTHNNNHYADFVRYFCDEFKCGDCREHCGSFLNKIPPEKFKGQEWGMSEHSRQFHNAANKGLGKPIMDWETYQQIWIDKDSVSFCTKGCGDKKEKYGPEELSAINFTRLKKVGLRDPELVQVRKSDMPPKGTGNLTLVKRKGGYS